MILVKLGTQNQDFSRLLNYIEKSKIKDEIIVQAGHTKFKSKKMRIFDFIDFDQMKKYIDECDLVITHGGTGSIVESVQLGQKVIACARKQKYGEHADDHQEEIVKVFAESGYILELNEENKLDDLMKKLKTWKPKPFKSNTKNFVKKLKNEINK
jgi:UDP-N-acetylglucosamine transferase subunit ALG13